ncbi:SCO3242 family prenyltransferase [Streptomyces griseorubiginosus]|uniref:SCO3242 family prenyltransferase n=1 Tax=Streptomyces griseorubiginosus TaxID=67304 RepID=UPI0036E53A16
MRERGTTAAHGSSEGGGAGTSSSKPTAPPSQVTSHSPVPQSRARRDSTDRADRADRARAWAELLRLPALFTVPGDALAGAAAASARPTPRTFLAIASSLCLYEAGMALNDWADREVDAVERPHRPLPSGRIHPAAALGAACVLTGAGLSFAACAGRPALAVAVPLAATVWAYDLALKNTPLGPVAMATARCLDLLLGATATAGGGAAARRRGGGGAGRVVDAGADDVRRAGGAGRVRRVVGGGGGLSRTVGVGEVGRTVGAVDGSRVAGALGTGQQVGAVGTSAAAVADEVRAALRAGRTQTAFHGIRHALPSAALLGAHTLALTTVSRREAQGGAPLAPLAALAATAALTRLVARGRPLPTDRLDESRSHVGALSAIRRPAAALSRPPGPCLPTGDQTSQRGFGLTLPAPSAALRIALATTYAVTAARPYFHAALNPSPPLTQRAVTGGIRATIPLQAALTARSGTKAATLTALLTTTLAPLAARFARKVSVT